MKLTISIKKRYLSIFLFIISLSLAIASINPDLPNHPANQVSLDSGEDLQEAIDGGAIGGSGESQWTDQGGYITPNIVGVDTFITADGRIQTSTTNTNSIFASSSAVGFPTISASSSGSNVIQATGTSPSSTIYTSSIDGPAFTATSTSSSNPTVRITSSDNNALEVFGTGTSTQDTVQIINSRRGKGIYVQSNRNHAIHAEDDPLNDKSTIYTRSTGDGSALYATGDGPDPTIFSESTGLTGNAIYTTSNNERDTILSYAHGGGSAIRAIQTSGNPAILAEANNGPAISASSNAQTVETLRVNSPNYFAIMATSNSQNNINAAISATNTGTGRAIIATSTTGTAILGISSSGYAVYANGNLYANQGFKPGGGSWVDSSDIRLKKNINQLEGSLDLLLKLKGVEYEWINPGNHGNKNGKQIGMVAQDVEKVFPQWVGEDIEGYKTLGFTGFEALTVEAFREQQNKIEDLKYEINKLKEIICSDHPEKCKKENGSI